MTDRHAIESPTVLANRGIPVLVYKVEGIAIDGQSAPQYRPLHNDATDEYEIEHKFVSLTALAIAVLEEQYGTLEGWQGKLAEQRFRTVLTTLSAVWGESRGQVSARLFEGRIDEYVLALQIAAYRAQGISVDDLGKLLKRGMEETNLAVRMMAATAAQMVQGDIPDLTDDEMQRLMSGESLEQVRPPTPTASDAPETSEPEPQPTSEPDSKADDPAPTRGRTGSPRGSKRAAPSPSSGRSRPRKSASRSTP